MIRTILASLLLTGLSLSASERGEALTLNGYTPIEDLNTLTLENPTFKERKTAKIELENGLQAYLISDPHLEKSGALLSVKVGSWDDPNEYPGMAHFLEHMLFLGTEKYPEEAEYSAFIKQHDGMSNAFTSSTHTSYLFSIDNSAFTEALDRFSFFFKKPLFNPSGVAREIHAIDQEFAQNLNRDEVREAFVMKELASPSHPFHRFNIGNHKTLSSVLQETLKKWYTEHYSASLMRLVVYSTLPLDKLTEVVVEAFKEVPNYNHAPSSFQMPLFPSEFHEQMVYIEPIKNKRELNITWELPAKFASFLDSRPDLLVTHLLGHEGKESLLAQLKREKLAERISCGSYRVDQDLIELVLEISLTESGVKHVELVIERVFQAIAMLKKQGIPRYIFDEVQEMSRIRYAFQMRDETFNEMMQHGDLIFDEPLASYPQKSSTIGVYAPEQINELLSLLTPRNAIYTLVAPSSLTKVKTDRREEWMDIPYTVQPIPSSQLEEWIQLEAHPKIQLPAPNPFIPHQLEILPHLESSQTTTPETTQLAYIPQPIKLLSGEDRLVYYAKDSYYQMPYVYLSFEIKTPQIQSSHPRSIVLADLLIKSLEDALNSSTYPATIAGLSYELKQLPNGISFSVSGFNENSSKLVQEITHQIKNLKVSEKHFKIYKNSLLNKYQNGAKEIPLVQAMEKMRSILYKNYVEEQEKAAAIRPLSYEEFKQFLATVFQQRYFQILFYGNLTQNEAQEIALQVIDELPGEIYKKEDHLFPEVVLLPEGKGPFFLEYPTKMAGNGTILVIESPPFSFKRLAAQQVVLQALDEPFFSQLRTQQQTGYIVSSMGMELERELFSFFFVQSNSHEGRDLLARFELFIEQSLREASSLFSEERFSTIRQALLQSATQPPQNLIEMGRLLQELAFKKRGEFQWIEEKINGYRELTYKECLEWMQEALGRSNHRRFAILVNGILPKENIFRYEKLPNEEALRRLSRYIPQSLKTDSQEKGGSNDSKETR